MTCQVIDALTSAADDGRARSERPHGRIAATMGSDMHISTTSIPAEPAAGPATSVAPTRGLRLAWTLDAAGSAATGLAMLVGADAIAGLTGLSPRFLVVSAIVFAPYVLLLVWLARRERPATGLAWAPVPLNAAWAAICIAVAAATGGATAATFAFLAVHITWGLGFAVWQWLGMRRSLGAAR
jgi:hypothetical protein